MTARKTASKQRQAKPTSQQMQAVAAAVEPSVNISMPLTAATRLQQILLKVPLPMCDTMPIFQAVTQGIKATTDNAKDATP